MTDAKTKPSSLAALDHINTPHLALGDTHAHQTVAELRQGSSGRPERAAGAAQGSAAGE